MSSAGGSGEDSENSQEVNGMSLSALLPYINSNPSNVVTATVVGLGNIIIGGLCATVAIIGGPIKGAIDGYSTSGVIGATVGVGIGALVGAIGGVALAVGGVATCLWQITFGLIRTPGSVFATATGQDWDGDASEFVYYDLKSDSEKSLISDEEFNALYQEKGSLAGIFGSTSSALILAPVNEKSAAKKKILDRQLYDVLGVEPEATVAEIKKSYYVQARKHHPDRNRDDPESHSKFQKVGEAYQILSDERLRKAYDEKGKEALDSTPKMEAGALYAMIFGSEMFEHIIGELQVATHIKALTEPGANTNSEYLQFRQRRREVQCAVNLATKLDVYIDDGLEEFVKRTKAEVKELSECSMGAVLLQLIGHAYIDKVNMEVDPFSGLGVKIKQTGVACVELCQTVSLGSQTIFSFLEVQRQQQLAEARQAEEDDRNSVPEEVRKARNKGPMGAGPIGPGPNATEEEKKHFRDAAKSVSANMLGLMWQVTKMDILSTLNNVCSRVLHDHSQPAERLQKRREGLLILGQEYTAIEMSTKQGMDDLLAKIGMQSGFFGPEPESAGGGNSDETYNSSPPGSKEGGGAGGSKAGGGGGAGATESPVAIMNKLSEMSVKELKAAIESFGASHADCVEKKDLRRKLKTVLSPRLTEEELRAIVKAALDAKATMEREADEAGVGGGEGGGGSVDAEEGKASTSGAIDVSGFGVDILLDMLLQLD